MENEIITIDELDEKYEQFQALLQQEKNRSTVLQMQLNSARQTIRRLREELDEADERKLLTTISENCRAAKEQAAAAKAEIIAESARRRIEEQEAREKADRQYRAMQKAFARVSVAVLMVFISTALFLMFYGCMTRIFQVCSGICCAVLSCFLGFFINDFIRILGKDA